MTLRMARESVGKKVLEVNMVGNLAAEYLNNNRQIKALQARQEAIKAELKAAAESGGTVNEKGHYVLNEGQLRITNEKRVRVGLADNAEELLKEWGVFDEVKKEAVDEQLVEQAFYNKRITDEQLAQLTERKESYALFVEETDAEGKTQRGRNYGG